MLQSAITQSNLLNKICFVKYGSNIEQSKEDIRRDMYKFLRKSAYKPISRQTIKFWLDNNNEPKRQQAFEFIYMFFDDVIERSELDDSKKKVFDQLKRFLSRKIEQHGHTGSYIHKNHVKSARNSGIVIQTTSTDGDFERIASRLLGYYDVYHYRFTENDSEPIAREFIEVFKRGREIRFKLWFRNDAETLSELSGGIFHIGSTIWLMGVVEGEQDRLRVMSFRDIDSEDHKYQAFRWGVMMSDIPNPLYPNPAACRFLMIKTNPVRKDSLSIALDRVGAMSYNSLESWEKLLLRRFIDNKLTAVSDRHSFKPSGKNGDNFSDLILKTDQETTESGFQYYKEMKEK